MNFGETSGGPPTRTVSRFAATEIGQGRTVDERAHYKDHFKAEAAQVSQYLQGIHHARKLDFMQVGYSDTIGKLSKMQTNVPVVLQRQPEPEPRITSKNTQSDAIKLAAWERQMNSTIAKESHDNQMKRYRNREVGRKATVNEIMAGRFQDPEKHGLGYDIFPQRCTHTQILAMTHNLAMPSADVIPAPPAPRRKWLGEGVGWSDEKS